MHTEKTLTYRIFAVLLLTVSPHAPAQDAAVVSRIMFEPRALHVVETAEDGTLSYDVMQGVEVYPVNPGELVGSITGLDDELTEEDLLYYTEQVTQLVDEGGVYNVALTESLMDMGTALKDSGEYEQALAVFEQAFHINRINLGLFNEQQVPIINNLTEVHISMGNYVLAHEQQDYLYYLRSKLDSDSEQPPLQALIDLADWNLDVARTAYTYDFNDSLLFQLDRLAQAASFYGAISQSMWEAEPPDPGIPGIEIKRAMSNYYLAQLVNIISRSRIDSSAYFSDSMSRTYYADGAMAPRSTFSSSSGSATGLDSGSIYHRSSSYNEGRDALQNRINYLQANGADPELLIRASLDLADWHLLFQRRNTALELYNESYNQLSESGLANTAALQSEFFSPQLPQTIPSYIPVENSRDFYDIPEDIELSFQGYIDVSFNLNRYGSTSRVRLMDDAENNNNALLRELRYSISNTNYRPYMDMDPAQEQTEREFNVRYYYTYILQPAPLNDMEQEDTEAQAME